MHRLATVFAGFALALSSPAAFAQQASSSAYALSANENVSAGGVVTANVSVGPLSQSSGSAPPSYNNSNSLASVNQSAALTTGVGGVSENLQTGLLTSNATGSSTAAQSSATVNNLQLSLAQSALLNTLLGLNATTIQSSSQANSIGGLDASGATTIEGLSLYGALTSGLTIDASLFVNPAPNTVLLSIAGLTITLNEQSMFGNGINDIGISTNAIDLAFNNFALGTNLLNGNIILGHSQAYASLGQGTAAVPEPSTWAMMLLGFAGLGMVLRWRRSDRNLLQLA